MIHKNDAALQKWQNLKYNNGEKKKKKIFMT